MAPRAQAEACALLVANGIMIVTLANGKLSSWREKLLESQDQLAREINIDESLIQMATTGVNSASRT